MKKLIALRAGKAAATAILVWALSGNLANAALKDDLKRGAFRASICNIDEMDVSFKVDEAFGELLVTSNMKWRGSVKAKRSKN